MTDKQDTQDWTGRVGNRAQLGGIETSVIDNGPGRGCRIAWVDTGSGLRYKVVLDRAADIADAFYNAHSLAWMSSAGITAPQAAANIGSEWLYTFAGGLMTTCGLSHIGPPEQDEHGTRGLHGRISNIPAEVESIVQPDIRTGDPDMHITARVRESTVFGPCLELKRTISGRLKEPVIRIEDTVTNCGNTPAAHMFLYHCNFGWPLVDEGTQIIYRGACRSRGLEMDDAVFSSDHDYRTCTGPLSSHRGGGEAAGFIQPEPEKDGLCRAGLIHAELGLAVRMTFPAEQLPCLTNWQHFGPGEYVCALEPGNAYPVGQGRQREQGELEFIEPEQSRHYSLDIEVLTGHDDIETFRQSMG